MCGVAGSFSVAGRGDPSLRSAQVGRMLEEIASRGPDHRGVREVAGRGVHAVLGHNRLSIIDLSALGHQPMPGPQERLWLTYNGEIYNYLEIRQELVDLGERFQSASDSEVLLHAWTRWGEGALDRCNGMFAFAMVDQEQGTCTLVRDRFGVKPLYYALHDGALLFASTPGAVARRIGARPSLAYAIRGLSTSLFEGTDELAPYDGVRAVPPGHLVRCRRRGDQLDLEVVRWYDLVGRVRAMRDGVAAIADPDALAQTGALLDSAVRLRLRSDVRVGVSLSGGVDSSTVSVLGAGASGALHGFSFGDPDDARSEGPLVDTLARRLGIPVTFIKDPTGRLLTDLFEGALAAQDAPFASASIIAQHAVFQAARRDGVTVMLGGQGGDEAFMGYHKFKLFHAQALAREGRMVAAAAQLATGIRAIGASGTSGRLWRRQFARYLGRGTQPLLRTPELPAPSFGRMGLGPDETLWQRQARDITDLSLPTLLRYEDRNSMGHSIESRLPFVDYRVVEFGLALPERLKLREGMGKWIVRRAMQGRLPEAIRSAKWKRGFDTDQPRAIAAGLGTHLRRSVAEVLPTVRPHLATAIDVDARFSDARLGSEPAAFLEAVTLIWLGRRGG